MNKAERFFRSLEERADTTVRKLSLPTSLPFPVLVLRATADEASSALGGVQILSKIFSAATAFMTRRFPFGKLLAVYFGGFLALYVLLFLWIIFVSEPVTISDSEDISFHLGIPEWLRLLAYIAMLSLMIAVALMIALIAVTLLLAVIMLPFDRDFALASPFVRISAESQPPGSWSVAQLLNDENAHDDEGAIQHSTHSNSVAVRHIAEWMRGVLNQPQRGLGP